MAITYDDAMSVLQEIFEDLADDLDLEDETLDPNAKILDLGMESISLVYLISELQQQRAWEPEVWVSAKTWPHLAQVQTSSGPAAPRRTRTASTN